MSYTEIKVQDCYNTCFNGKLHRFLEISFLATKYHALNNKHWGIGCSRCVFHDILVRWHYRNKSMYCSIVLQHTSWPIPRLFKGLIDCIFIISPQKQTFSTYWSQLNEANPVIIWVAKSEHKFKHMQSMKIQISLCISAVWSKSSTGTFWIVKNAKFLHVDNEDWSLHRSR